MPLRKNISSLQNLCLDNITRNVIRHGELFKRCRTEEKVYLFYKVLQSHFCDDLLRRLFEIFGSDHKDENLKKLENFMLECKESGSRNDWPCLELLFNEYTTALLPSRIGDSILDKRHTDVGFVTYLRCERVEMPERFLSLITSKCKNVRRVNDRFCSLIGEKPNEVLAKFRNIQEADLGVIDNTDILKEILETCTTIRKLSAYGMNDGSDVFLFSLCKHISQQAEFNFCPENGNCSKSGKYLERLRMPHILTTGEGIACALQHLPRLKEFLSLPCKTYAPLLMSHLPDVPRGIIALKTAAAVAGRGPVILELQSLYLHKSLTKSEVHTIFSCCPKLESLQVNLHVVNDLVFPMGSFTNLKQLHLFKSTNERLNSKDLRELLSVQGKKLQAVSFMHSVEPLDLTYIHVVLNLCCNLRSLTVWSVQISNRSCSHLTTLPPCVGTLKHISMSFSTEHHFPQPCRKYFRELLCNATYVKYLTVGWYFAEAEFPHVIRKINFSSLEELSLHCDDDNYVREIPFEKLLKSTKCLRKINFIGYFRDSSTLALCKQLIRENNYEVQISHTNEIF